MKRYILLLAATLLLLAGCTGETTAGAGSAQRSISAYPASLELENGGSGSIQVVMNPAGDQAQDLLWVSSNSSVATVDNSGNVQAVGEGSCTITAASKVYSEVSCTVNVTVGGGAAPSQPAAQNQTQTQTANASDYEQYVTYARETNASSVYPAYALSEAEVSRMDGETLQFTINQIYAKNGYIFRTDSLQNYFSQMPWYTAVSNDTSSLRMSSLDRSNLNLLVRYRDQNPNRDSVSQMGWLWTRSVVDGQLTESYVRNLSSADVQLLINTIYAKNGYIFRDSALQALFSGQSWYHGVSRDGASLSFTSTDQANLRLLTAYR